MVPPPSKTEPSEACLQGKTGKIYNTKARACINILFLPELSKRGTLAGDDAALRPFGVQTFFQQAIWSPGGKLDIKGRKIPFTLSK